MKFETFSGHPAGRGFTRTSVSGSAKSLPDIIDSLQHGEMGEDGKNPEDGFHPVEEGSYGEKDDAFGPLHQADGAWDLQSFCLGSDVGDKHCPHTSKRSKEDEAEISFFYAIEQEGEKENKIRISIQD